MAFEQTINANSKIQQKSIMAFVDIFTAVNQWAVTASMKAKC